MLYGFFKTLIRPDWDDDPESGLIAQAANVLQVGEFQLLQLAYQEWFGREFPEHQSDVLFQAYMVHGETPVWAQSYARRILRQDEIGLIDSRDPTYHRYDHNYITHVPRGVRHFCMATMFVAFFLVGGILVGHLAGAEATSVLPPYFERGELSGQR